MDGQMDGLRNMCHVFACKQCTSDAKQSNRQMRYTTYRCAENCNAPKKLFNNKNAFKS